MSNVPTGFRVPVKLNEDGSIDTKGENQLTLIKMQNWFKTNIPNGAIDNISIVLIKNEYAGEELSFEVTFTYH